MPVIEKVKSFRAVPRVPPSFHFGAANLPVVAAFGIAPPSKSSGLICGALPRRRYVAPPKICLPDVKLMRCIIRLTHPYAATTVIK